jgi:hypothetical protein
MPVDQVSDSPALSGADIPRAAGDGAEEVNHGLKESSSDPPGKPAVQVRPLSKRKAKKARQKLARRAARLQQQISRSADELLAASN